MTHHREAPLLSMVAAAALCLVTAACPEPASEPKPDGGGADAAAPDAAVLDSAGQDRAVVDAGARDAAGLDRAGADAAMPDAVGSDAGSQPDTASGSDGARPDAARTDSASADAGACTPAAFTDCDGVAASGNSYTLFVDSAGVGGHRTFAAGDTLAEVSAAMSGLSGTVASFSVFARVYCSEGLLLYFADNLDAANAADEGVLSDDDLLYKVTAFGGFTGATNNWTALALGDSGATATEALGAADYTGSSSWLSGQTGEYRFFYSGVSALLVDDAVVALSLFLPQSPTGTIDAALDFAAGGVGAVNVTHSMVAMLPVASGSTLTQVRAAFGASPEADGDTSLSVGASSIDVLVLSYSALGLRFAGPAEQYSGFPPSQLTGDNRKVYTAVVTAPFQGSDSGVGIGSSQAEVEVLLGQPYATETDAEGHTMYKYEAGSRKVGVLYAYDPDCTARVVLLFVNLIDE